MTVLGDVIAIFCAASMVLVSLSFWVGYHAGWKDGEYRMRMQWSLHLKHSYEQQSKNNTNLEMVRKNNEEFQKQMAVYAKGQAQIHYPEAISNIQSFELGSSYPQSHFGGIFGGML